MSNALYEERDGALFATEYSAGPWDPGAQHGGPVAAILMRALENLDDGGLGLHMSRVTYELMRPTPVGRALQVSAEIVRPGKRVQLLEASLRTLDGSEVTRARAVRIAPPSISAGAQPPLAIAGPQESAAGFPSWGHTIFPGDGVEVRFAAGTFEAPGPTAAWFRLRVPVVAGEQPSPMQRLMAAADFPNGISTEISWDEWLFINPDLTVYVERLPVGEWIGVDAHMRVAEGGGAIAQGVLYDQQGRVGRSIQSLYVAHR